MTKRLYADKEISKRILLKQYQRVSYRIVAERFIADNILLCNDINKVDNSM